MHTPVDLTCGTGPSTGRGAVFAATAQWQYRVTPSSPIMRVACVSDLDWYRDLLRDPSMTAVWYFAPVDDLRADSPGVFELVQVTVNGHERSVRHAGRKGSQLSTVSLRKEHQAGEGITSFTYRVLGWSGSTLRPVRRRWCVRTAGRCRVGFTAAMTVICPIRLQRVGKY